MARECQENQCNQNDFKMIIPGWVEKFISAVVDIFEQWDPSAATPMEEEYGPQEDYVEEYMGVF